MLKRSSGFSGPAPVDGAEINERKTRVRKISVSWVGLIFIYVSALGSPWGFADDASIEPSPSASKRAWDPRFLLLPALDAERDAPAEVIKVGDGIRLKISGAPKGEFGLAVPSGSESLLEQGWTIRPDQGGSPGTLLFLAFPLKAGTLTLPSLAIMTQDGESVARTNPMDFQVSSGIAPNDPQPSEAAESRPMLGLEFPKWVWFAAGGLCVLLFALVIFGVIRLRSKIKPVDLSLAGLAPLHEDEEAILQLAELETQCFWIQGQHKKNAFRVSEILKRYFGRRYRFDGMESTSRELVNYLMLSASLARPRVLEVNDLFERLDRVKFTDYLPGPDESALFLVQARELVQATRNSWIEVKPDAI